MGPISRSPYCGSLMMLQVMILLQVMIFWCQERRGKRSVLHVYRVAIPYDSLSSAIFPTRFAVLTTTPSYTEQALPAPAPTCRPACPLKRNPASSTLPGGPQDTARHSRQTCQEDSYLRQSIKPTNGTHQTRPARILFPGLVQPICVSRLIEHLYQGAQRSRTRKWDDQRIRTRKWDEPMMLVAPVVLLVRLLVDCHTPGCHFNMTQASNTSRTAPDTLPTQWCCCMAPPGERNM